MVAAEMVAAVLDGVMVAATEVDTVAVPWRAVLTPLNRLLRAPAGPRWGWRGLCSSPSSLTSMHTRVSSWYHSSVAEGRSSGEVGGSPEKYLQRRRKRGGQTGMPVRSRWGEEQGACRERQAKKRYHERS